jgi:nifR3 family TIM-barrel protein
MRKFWDNSGNGSSGAGAPAREVLRPVSQSLHIGSVTISPATVLAPMAGVTDTVFRRFIRNLGGCGLIMTEFTSADGVLRKKDQKAKRYLHFYEDEHPISAQLFGSDPKVMAEAAKMVEGLGFDLVDLNLGCPAKKVVKCNGGSGLLRDLPAIGRIFESVRAAVKIPFTVKFRAGWNDEEIVCVELARMAENCGLAAVALHARTREMGYSGQARWEWIAAVKDAVKIPVIGNGDIRTPEDASAMVTRTNCDAVMIGRMAPSNPWIFRQIEQYSEAVRNEKLSGNGHVVTGAIARQVEQSSTAEASSAYQLEGTTNREEQAAHKQVWQAAAASESLNPSPCHPEEPLFGDEGPMQFADATTNARGDNGQSYDHPTESDRYQMIRTYFQMLIEEELPDAIGKMKQFASWFTHGVPGGAHLRKEIYESKSAPEVLGRVEDFFEARLYAPQALARQS